MTAFTNRVINIIAAIPPGYICTYGQIARAAGSPKGARQVARVLHSCSASHNLPWHRVVGSRGISLPRGGGFEEQASLLSGEGVRVGSGGEIELPAFQWDIPMAQAAEPWGTDRSL